MKRKDMKIDADIQKLDMKGFKKIAMQKERNDIDKIWDDFVEESGKLLAEPEEETKVFDSIMDAGAAARTQGKGKFPYSKYIKEEQMERFNERLAFRTFLLKRHGN
jgi:polyhydroxyalkanoate synthesis regulator phasin